MADNVTVVKRVKNAVLFSNGNIRIDGVRGSYMHVDAPYAGPAKPGEAPPKPAFSMTALLDKKTHKEAKDLVVESMNALIASKKDKAGKPLKIAADKKFIRNGDDSDKEEYAGMWTISARETKPPKLRDKNKNNVDRANAAAMFYSGAYYNVIINPWVQDNQYGKRVNANLVLVQFAKDGEPFGEGALSDEAADDMIDAAEEDDLDAEDEDMDDL